MHLKEANLRFSLVVATLGRTDSLSRLLGSLKAQAYQHFEVVLVDQNQPGFLDEILAPFQGCFPIVHLRSRPGLSVARNVGLGHVAGRVVAFPDDDCWYPPDALMRVANSLTSHPEWDGLTGRLVDQGNPDGHAWYERTGGGVNLENVWHRAISVTIFLRREIVQTVGAFDEDLGRGAASGMIAAEESDYLIRLLKQDFTLNYCAEISVYHRDDTHIYNDQRIARAYGEGLAFGYVLRRYKYSLPFVVRTWVRALGGAAQALVSGNWPRTCYYRSLLRGRIAGWFRLPCGIAAATKDPPETLGHRSAIRLWSK